MSFSTLTGDDVSRYGARSIIGAHSQPAVRARAVFSLSGPRTMPQQVMYEVEAVLSERGSGASHEYEVKWTGYAGTTWEPAASILEEVPLLVRRLHGRPPDVGMRVVIYREWPASTTDRAPEWYPGKVPKSAYYSLVEKMEVVEERLVATKSVNLGDKS